MTNTINHNVPHRFDAALAGFPPAYFALVMATGVLAVACTLLHIPTIPDALLAFNVAAYAVLWAINLTRMARYPKKFFGDFAIHQRGPGFFTMVAATSVLGVQLAVQRHQLAAARGLWRHSRWWFSARSRRRGSGATASW